ncbi:AlwI family type II restriction endonuclease [Vagococcus humatus]|uniref:AlwI family type II restriction endonuclease n=1 Tax=Vagococcus humatus TaxID=1889241 RepID=A0A3S0GDB3_9ENTE|nr:AlwI family type II restriction endonuclease [Vagococcus humatus]RST89218.1 AlwI family type II restriction endonuclease [Vagococcus humatus]
MASRNRDKQVWFVPKRANVHQMIALLHGIISRKYDGTTWNTSKQDNLNLELKKLGATQSGNKIAPQGMRTLLASLHYLGFVYLDTTTTPTTLRVTKAGYNFYSTHQNDLRPMDKLTKGLTIDYSESVLYQMAKLQITNPIILPHCEDIYVFPFRVTLQMLRTLNYLDMEEIAMFVFHTRDMSEIEYKISEILNFRNLNSKDREHLVNQYKATNIGNLTLKKAPSAGYFMAFCMGTGIMTKSRVDTNGGNKVGAISIKKNMLQWVDELLEFHKNTEIFDFEDNLNLWISYFGNPLRDFPPTLMKINNYVNNELYIEINDSQDNLIDTTIINANDRYFTPIFENENYTINIYNITDGTLIYSNSFISIKHQQFTIDDQLILKGNFVNEKPMFLSYSTLETNRLINEILDHSASKNFSDKMLIKLRLLQTKLGIDKFNDKSLRGAQYEYLFYLLLSQLKNRKIIDEVIWNGKIGNYNLPTQAPGGKTGTPDIIFILNNERYILELTTIKSKSMQFTAEGSSVPDHIKIYQEEYPDVVVKGIFCAPMVHERVHAAMNSILSGYNIPLISISDVELLNILNSESKQELSQKLNSIFN